MIVEKESGGGGSRFSRASEPGRVIGDHPDGGVISVKSGRFGPYVSWGKVNATIPRAIDPASVTMDQALEMIAAKSAGGGSTGGRMLGEHPEGGAITVRAGRFGPYVNLGKINATLPKSITAETVTLEDAIKLIDDKGGPPKKKAAPKRAANKKKVSPGDTDDKTPFTDSKPIKKAAAAKKTTKKAASKKAPTKKR